MNNIIKLGIKSPEKLINVIKGIIQESCECFINHLILRFDIIKAVIEIRK